MRHIIFLIFFIFPLSALANTAPDTLFRDANNLYQEAKLPLGEVTEANIKKCLKNGSSAQNKIDTLFSNHPNHELTKSLEARRLKGKITGAITQCKRAQKTLNKKPYEPKNRDHSVNF